MAFDWGVFKKGVEASATGRNPLESALLGYSGAQEQIKSKEKEDTLAKALYGKIGDNGLAGILAKSGQSKESIAQYNTEMSALEKAKQEQLAYQLKLKELANKQKSGENLSPFEKTMQQERAKQQADLTQQVEAQSSAMPALKSTVERLKGYGKDATSTIGGRAVDWLSQQTGMGATEGAKARTAFESEINNQLLPQLRQTFGAAFTERDREALQKTMGDPNLTPEEKSISLDTFIQNKQTELATKQGQLSKMGASTPNVSSLKSKYGLE
jgi:hypothetical protein